MMPFTTVAATVDEVNAAFFEGRTIAPARADEIVAWLAGRRIRSGRHSGLLAPSEQDYQQGVRLFTGERLRTKLATRHVLTAEAARAMVLLGTPSATVQECLERVGRRLAGECFAGTCRIGECAHSAVGLMRLLAAGGPVDAEAGLVGQIEQIREHRDGRGRWWRFPFYYTLLALTETELPSAVEELRYAAPACERVQRRTPHRGTTGRRRQVLVERALSRC